MSLSLKFRRAATKDIGVLTRWNKAPHVLEAGGGGDDWAAELPITNDWREVFIADAGARPIGVIQWADPFREDSHYWGAVAPNQRAIDIWIGEENALGKGFGTQMMKFAIQRCFSDASIQAILVDPLATNKASHRFYERLGFKFVERRQFDEDSDCYVYKLTREDWDSLSDCVS